MSTVSTGNHFKVQPSLNLLSLDFYMPDCIVTIVKNVNTSLRLRLKDKNIPEKLRNGTSWQQENYITRLIKWFNCTNTLFYKHSGVKKPVGQLLHRMIIYIQLGVTVFSIEQGKYEYIVWKFKHRCNKMAEKL